LGQWSRAAVLEHRQISERADRRTRERTGTVHGPARGGHRPQGKSLRGRCVQPPDPEVRDQAVTDSPMGNSGKTLVRSIDCTDPSGKLDWLRTFWFDVVASAKKLG